MTTPIRSAEIERAGTTLEVRWDGGEVAVHVSESPDERGRLVHAGATAGTTRIEGLDPATRYYVHLVQGERDVTVVAERLVPLEGTLNFRDLGGYRGLDGRRVRWGRVFRSDHFGAVTGADLAALDRLGVKTIIDFRGAHEHAHTPSRIAEDGPIRRLDRPISDGHTAAGTLYDRVSDGSLPEFSPQDLARFYVRTLDESAPVFGEVLTLLADPAEHAVVFHCTAGKDRTGLTAALLLGALGVADEDILDDYELTNRYRSGRRLEVLRPELAAKGIDIEKFRALFVAPRESMAAALADLRERYGEVATYLVEAADVDPGAIDALRRLLLEARA